MSLACQNNDISRLSMVNGICNGFFSVADFNITAAGLLYACLDILDNILGFFKSGIIRSDNGQIGIISTDFSHLKTAYFRTVSAASKQTYEPLRLILSKRCQKAL